MLKALGSTHERVLPFPLRAATDVLSSGPYHAFAAWKTINSSPAQHAALLGVPRLLGQSRLRNLSLCPGRSCTCKVQASASTRQLTTLRVKFSSSHPPGPSSQPPCRPTASWAQPSELSMHSCPLGAACAEFPLHFPTRGRHILATSFFVSAPCARCHHISASHTVLDRIIMINANTKASRVVTNSKLFARARSRISLGSVPTYKCCGIPKPRSFGASKPVLAIRAPGVVSSYPNRPMPSPCSMLLMPPARHVRYAGFGVDLIFVT